MAQIVLECMVSYAYWMSFPIEDLENLYTGIVGIAVILRITLICA